MVNDREAGFAGSAVDRRDGDGLQLDVGAVDGVAFFDPRLCPGDAVVAGDGRVVLERDDLGHWTSTPCLERLMCSAWPRPTRPWIGIPNTPDGDAGQWVTVVPAPNVPATAKPALPYSLRRTPPPVPSTMA